MAFFVYIDSDELFKNNSPINNDAERIYQRTRFN